MITPRFSCTQDYNFIVIVMKLKHVKISEVQFVVEGCRMSFYAKPYFLRLTFDQEVVDDETGKASFDVEKEEMKVLVPKKNKGEVFTDLDCLTKLLSTEIERKKLVEEINDKEESSSDEEFDYETRQCFPDDRSLNEFYGFNDEFTNFFSTTSTELPVTDVDSVDTTPYLTRISQMRQSEAESFISGVEHYMADHFDDAEIRSILAHDKTPPYYAEGATPPTWETLQHLGTGTSAVKGGVEVIDEDTTSSEEEEHQQQQQPVEEPPVEEVQPAPKQFVNPGDIGRTEFTTGGGLGGYVTTDGWEGVKEKMDGEGEVKREEVGEVDVMKRGVVEGWEKEMMLRLPKKRYLVVNEEEVMAGLVDLLAAFVYEHLTTDGEGSTESVWTYTKLSPSLSHVVKLPTLRHAVICFMRRVVTYPLHRHYTLAQRCIWDVAHLLSTCQKLTITRCLLRMKHHIDKDESKYPLSKLYLAPYATYVQSVEPETLQKYGAKLAATLAGLKKPMLDLPLAEMEALGEMGGPEVEPEREF